MSNSTINRVIKFGLVFSCITHITTCFFIFIGFYSREDLNWIISGGFSTDFVELYISSLYFNLVTIYSIGYGDITPVNTIEKIWVCILMMMGSFLYSYVVSSLSTIFSNTTDKYNKYKEKLKVLQSISDEYNLSQNLHHKLKQNVKQEYNKNDNERYEFLEYLPSKIKSELTIIMYQATVAENRFFNNQPDDFTLYVLQLLKSHKVYKGDILISVGDIVEEMYFVLKGSLTLNLGLHNSNKEICQIRKKNYFGDLLMHIGQKSPYELKGKKKVSEIFVLKKADFLKIKNSYSSRGTSR